MRRNWAGVLGLFVAGLVSLSGESVSWAAGARLRVAVVIDASGSMKKQDRNQLSKVAAKLFVDLAGPEDEVGIVEFGTSARLIDKTFVTDENARARLFRAIDAVGRSQECTDYRAGLIAALQMFRSKPAPGERRLIVFLTDGSYDPDRSNHLYYDLVPAALRGKLYSKKVADFYTKIKDDPAFKQRACHPRYKLLEPAAKAGFLVAFQEFLKKQLVPSGVRVFVIGMGTALTGNPKGAKGEALARSVGLLRQLAQATRGRALIEHDVSKIPGFFAEIFAALVGAPVESLPSHEAGGATPFDFKVVEGTKALAMVVPTIADKTFDVELGLVQGGKVTRVVPATRARHQDEVGSGRDKGRILAGYRLLWLSKPAAGTYRLLPKGKPKGGLHAQVIMDVGLRLAWLDPRPTPVYPEKKSGKLSFTFAMRSASGKKVAGLSRSFMAGMRFFWMLRRIDGKQSPLSGILARGKPAFDPGSPMKPVRIELDRAKLVQGRYRLEVWAAHDKGFFELRRLSAEFRVVQYVHMKTAWTVRSFDAKAKKGWRLSGWLSLHPAKDIESVQWFWLDLSNLEGREDFRITFDNDTKECPVHGQVFAKARYKVCLKRAGQGITMHLALADWKGARSRGRSLEGKVRLIAASPQIFEGPSRWEQTVKGSIQTWAFWDWVRYYRNWILAGLVLFFLVLWVLGRILAGAFPPKATFYYVDLEDNVDEPSRFALGRRVKSHLPFVSAKHHIGGKGGLPRGAKRLATLQATSGGFFILPVRPVRAKEDGEEHRAKFRGRFDDHYVVGDRYEFWVTRRPED